MNFLFIIAFILNFSILFPDHPCENNKKITVESVIVDIFPYTSIFRLVFVPIPGLVLPLNPPKKNRGECKKSFLRKMPEINKQFTDL